MVSGRSSSRGRSRAADFSTAKPVGLLRNVHFRSVAKLGGAGGRNECAAVALAEWYSQDVLIVFADHGLPFPLGRQIVRYSRRSFRAALLLSGPARDAQEKEIGPDPHVLDAVASMRPARDAQEKGPLRNSGKTLRKGGAVRALR